MDPASQAQAISQQGWPYLYAATTIIAGIAVGYLFRALIAAKDKLAEVEDAHGKEVSSLKDANKAEIVLLLQGHMEVVSGLFRGQLAVNDETKIMLSKIHEAMQRVLPKSP